MDFKNLQISPDAFRQPEQTDMYKEFEATELYCPRCQQAVPVRKRLLLILPEGEKYEYLCGFCSESVGTKIDKQQKPVGIIV
ncbi:MAG: cytoplasmic protein [Deltaproteobacteria bacterium]|nr:cytoplasmic protein [Deltaproteobacteria bacterium]MBW1960551.1 cytoplasmic protein [Deltaproteobacteria bacterium]MBW2150658.1 cytoplasmic protein [Deltaproteobacteria bacterium]